MRHRSGSSENVPVHFRAKDSLGKAFESIPRGPGSLGPFAPLPGVSSFPFPPLFLGSLLAFLPSGRYGLSAIFLSARLARIAFMRRILTSLLVLSAAFLVMGCSLTPPAVQSSARQPPPVMTPELRVALKLAYGNVDWWESQL